MKRKCPECGYRRIEIVLAVDMCSRCGWTSRVPAVREPTERRTAE